MGLFRPFGSRFTEEPFMLTYKVQRCQRAQLLFEVGLNQISNIVG